MSLNSNSVCAERGAVGNHITNTSVATSHKRSDIFINIFRSTYFRGIIDKLLFYHVSFAFLLSNILIAHFGGNQIVSLSILLVRDSWVLTLTIALLLRRNWQVVGFLTTAFIFGCAPAFDPEARFVTTIFLYGLRDVFLIGFVYYIIGHNNFLSHKNAFNIFILLVLSLALLQLTLQLLGLDQLDEQIFRTDQYFSSKGVVSNIEGGILGFRLTAPFYSASLLATLFILVVVLTDFKWVYKWTLSLASLFTVSKVVPLVVVAYIFRRHMIVAAMGIAIAIVSFYLYLQMYIDSFEQSIFTFHAASMLDRVNALSALGDKGAIFGYPDLLGSNSILSAVLLGLDPSSAPESMIIAKILDFKWTFIFVAFFVIAAYKKTSSEKKFLLFIFFAISILSGLSNHPICFLPFAFVSKKAG